MVDANRSQKHAAPAGGSLRPGIMGVSALVFLVMAFQAPLTAVAGNMPLIVGLGNGAGAPLAFIVSGVVLTLFAVPFVAMSHRITNAGAFYSYISAGLGRPAGVAAGWLAVCAYNVIMLVPIAYAGYFGNQVFRDELSIDVPWTLISAAILIFAWLVGIRGIELNTVIMGCLLCLEVGILVLVVAGALLDPSTDKSLIVSDAFSGNIGVAFTFALLSFVGFEATAVFGEEARNPERTVGKATYAAVWVIAILYALVAWAVISVYPRGGVVGTALDSPGTFLSGAAVKLLGPWAEHVINWLLLASLVAVSMAVHNMASRYLFAFGRDRLLPRALGRTHHRYQTPYLAATVQMLLMVGVIVACLVTGTDPYLKLGAVAGGFATMAIVALMATTCAAAMLFLRRAGVSVWVGLIAPGIALVALLAALWLIWSNFTLLAGETVLADVLKWSVIPLAVGGFLHGLLTTRTPGAVTSAEQT
ncbi:APC family permease [Sphaerisporangium viridialbum]|uniref:APC family permease n=1 Tax=Sphaerisporangium viridialbum TaxID=46189 RepID=UPI003C75FEFC